MNCMVKYRWTKYLYTVAMFMFVISSLTVPYARSEDVDKKIFILFVLMQLLVQIIFRSKFDYGLEMTPLLTFYVYTFVSHFVPFGYYFMLRRVFKPTLMYVVLIGISVAIQIFSLYIFENNYKFKVREVDIDEQ